MTKKLSSIITGRKDEASKAFLTLILNAVVAKA